MRSLIPEGTLTLNRLGIWIAAAVMGLLIAGIGIWLDGPEDLQAATECSTQFAGATL